MPDSLQILTIKINTLQAKLDSLQAAAKYEQLAYRLQDQQNIIGHVNEFYGNAWHNLLWFVGAFAFVLGLVVPVVIQWWQNRSNRLLTQQLEQQFENRLEDLRAENRGALEVALLSFKEDAEDLQESILKKSFEINATAADINARTHLDKTETVLAAADYITSAYWWLKTDRKEEIKKELLMAGICFRHFQKEVQLKKVDFNLKKLRINKSLNKVINLLKKDPDKHLYMKELENIIESITRVRKSPEGPQSQETVNHS